MYNRISSLQAIKKKIRTDMYNPVPQGNYLEEKINELRQDPKYANWSDQQLNDYASSLINKSNALTRQLGFERVASRLGKPVDPIWSQFTYEELLQMEDGGVIVPEEFLEWAHSMEEADVSDYELDDTDSLNENGADTIRADAGGAGSVGEKKTVKALSRQVVLKREVLEDAQKEFEQYSTALDSSVNSAEQLQNDSLKKVQAMMSEWQVLDKKAKSGESLTPEEQNRYGQIGVMMNNEVNASNVDITNFTSDFDKISELMKSTSKEAKLAQDFVTSAELMGNLVPVQEGKHNYMSVNENRGFTGSFGLMDILKSASVGKNIAVDTIKKTNELQIVSSKSNKSIREVSDKMKSMTDIVDSGNINILNEVENIESEPSYENVGDVQETPPPPPTDGMDAPLDVQAQKDDSEEENSFVEEEDFNDINSILKRQQKKAPEPEIEQVVIE